MNVLVLGKFLPYHNGHAALINHAKNYGKVTVVIGPRWNEPVSCKKRVLWLTALNPGVRVVQVSHSLPSWPGSDPKSFWDQWTAAINHVMPEGVDIVVSSESYGEILARRLNAKNIFFDLGRTQVPVSGTEIRQNIFHAFDKIPPLVRQHFRRVVVVTGGESVGKTTLIQTLAHRYPGLYTPVYEYGRKHMADRHIKSFTPWDATRIAAMQSLLVQDALLLPESNGIILSDTDALTTLVWAEMAKLNPEGIDAVRRTAQAKVPHLTLLMPPTQEWANDGTREWSSPEVREEFYIRLRNHMDNSTYRRPYVIIQSTWAAVAHDEIRRRIDNWHSGIARWTA